MTDLLLQPTGDPDDYEVAADGQIVGRVVLLAGAWSWAIDTAFREGRHPAFGFESNSRCSSSGIHPKLVRWSPGWWLMYVSACSPKVGGSQA